MDNVSNELNTLSVSSLLVSVLDAGECSASTALSLCSTVAASTLLATLSDAPVTGSLSLFNDSLMLVCSTFCGLLASTAGAFCELVLDDND